MSWPITTMVPRQHGQAPSAGSITTSTRGRCAGSLPRAFRRFSVASARRCGDFVSASASLAAIEAAISSNAKCS